MEYNFDVKSLERIFVFESCTFIDTIGCWSGSPEEILSKLAGELSKFVSDERVCYRGVVYDYETYEIHKYVIETDEEYERRQNIMKGIRQRKERASKKKAASVRKKVLLQQSDDEQREIYEALKQKFGQ